MTQQSESETEVQDTGTETRSAPARSAPEPSFDLLGIENPNFALLQAGRGEVYASREALAAFRKLVDGLPAAGETGRRKGLGLWMLGDHEAAVKQLALFDKDDVASFTRARALLSLGRPEEALPIFDRLTAAYPDEPRPRGGALEARLEIDLAKAKGSVEGAAASLKKALAAAPAAFRASAAGHHLAGRLLELERDHQAALDQYLEAYELDTFMRQNTFRAAHLAERSGIDDLAMHLYEDLVRQPPVDANLLINLGVLYEDLGRDQDAAACYETVAKSLPQDPRARLYLTDAVAGIHMYYDEDQERKEDRLNQILRIPITDFELSVRARNCLSKMEIATLGDLVCRTEQELLSYKNFGETSLNEIKEILQSKGLRLGMSREEAAASVEASVHRTVVPGEGDDNANRPISDLQLSIRARRTVEALGCLSIGEITKHSAEELLGMPNFGQTSLQELRSKLAERNLKLRGE